MDSHTSGQAGKQPRSENSVGYADLERELRDLNLSMWKVAEVINSYGIKTPEGRKYTAFSVAALLEITKQTGTKA